MESTLSRWLMAGIWLFAVAAMVCGSLEGAGSTAALWSLPVAVLGSLAMMGWPARRGTLIMAAASGVWQLALIGAWWPFAARAADDAPVGPMHWPMQSLLIGGVIALLLLAFVSMFLLPGIGLSRRLGRAAQVVESRPADHEQQLDAVFASDGGATQAWHDYQAQLSRASAGDASGSSRASAREWFDMHRFVEARLRLEFFRHLPGMFTGLGIIGTFTGLILGLRSFRIASDPEVVQHSLERLLGGVWEAFLVSAMAITLSISVTIVEKMVMSALSRRLERVAMGLDHLHPPRGEEAAPAWLSGVMSRAIADVSRSHSRIHTTADMTSPNPGAKQEVPAADTRETLGRMTPMPRVESVLGAPDGAQRTPGSTNTSGVDGSVWLQALEPLLRESALHARSSAQAIIELSQRLPAVLAEQQLTSQQLQQQSQQVMKALANRLEGLASSIELGARRTLEGVASRLMQSEMDMVARHHAVTEHLVEVVQRVEVLCGLLQRDRAESFDDSRQGMHHQQAWPEGGIQMARATMAPHATSTFPVISQPYDAGRMSHSGTNGNASGPHVGEEYGYPMDDEVWGDRPSPPTGGFGT